MSTELGRGCGPTSKTETRTNREGACGGRTERAVACVGTKPLVTTYAIIAPVLGPWPLSLKDLGHRLHWCWSWENGLQAPGGLSSLDFAVPWRCSSLAAMSVLQELLAGDSGGWHFAGCRGRSTPEVDGPPTNSQLPHHPNRHLHAVVQGRSSVPDQDCDNEGNSHLAQIHKRENRYAQWFLSSGCWLAHLGSAMFNPPPPPPRACAWQTHT